MNKKYRTGDIEKKEVMLTETVSSVFFVADNYNFKIVYTNDIKIRKINKKIVKNICILFCNMI